MREGGQGCPPSEQQNNEIWLTRPSLYHPWKLPEHDDVMVDVMLRDMVDVMLRDMDDVINFAQYRIRDRMC